MPDENKPPEYPTTQISSQEIVNAQLKQIFESVEATRHDVTRANVNLDLLTNDVVTLKDRQALTEQRLNDYDSRATRVSNRVREQSSTDLTHEAQIASEKTARESLAKDQAALVVKVDALAKEHEKLTETNATQLRILEGLERVTSHPAVKAILHAAGVAILTWFAARGLK